MDDTNSQQISLTELKKDLTFFNAELNNKILAQNSKIKYFITLNLIVLILVAAAALFIVKKMNHFSSDHSFKNTSLKRQK